MTRRLPVVQGDRGIVSQSPLQIYMREVAKYPLLSPEEELELAIVHFEKKDIHAAHRLVTSNLRLVVKIANDFRRAQLGLLDLIQEGNYGLMQAVKRFNPYRGVKLSSYSAWWIRAYILRYIMDNRSQVKIGTTAAQRKLYYNLRKETERLLSEYESVDTKLLAASLDVKEKEVMDMQQRLSSPDVSMDAPLSDDDSTSRGNLIASDLENPEDRMERLEMQHIFKEHLVEFERTLKDRELQIFKMRLLSDEPMTLQEIGDRYGITRERARQLEEKIMKNFKAYIKSRGVIDV